MYSILLDNKIIGTTELEKADAPMGVVFGKINFTCIDSGYDFFKAYCKTNNINIVTDYPEDKIITTANIPNLKVINQNEIEIIGKGVNIEGMDTDIFEIIILGIADPFYQDQFPLHVQNYNEMFKD